MNNEDIQREEAEKIIAAQLKAGIKCMRIRVPTDISRKMRSYILMAEDIKFVDEATSELISRLENRKVEVGTVDTALWQSIIITYSKLFTASKTGYSFLKISCYDNQNEYIATHEKLSNLRNKFVAHREESIHERAEIFLITTKYKENAGEVKYHAKSISMSCPPVADLVEYMKVFKVLSQIINDKIEKEASRIWDIVSKFEREKLLQLMVDDKFESLA